MGHTRVIKATFDDLFGLTRWARDAVWPAQLADGLIALHIIEQILDIDLHGWAPVRDHGMGCRQCTLSSSPRPDTHMSAACQRMHHGLTARPAGGSVAPCRHGRARQAPHRAGGAAVDRAHCGTDGDRRFQGWSEDGARFLSPGVDNSARLLYICVDPCRYAATADRARGT